MSPTAVAAPVAAAPPHLDLPFLNEGSPTTWANLGDWTAATTYPAAARALALRLGTAAALQPGQDIADVGVGAGEQLLLWLEHFGVAHVSASDRSAAFAAAATARVAAAGLASRATVVAAEASALGVPPRSVDHVLALDCAYHFADRAAFFRRAAAALRPDGRIALTDVACAGRSSWLLRTMARASRIPPANLISAAAYTDLVQQAGFTAVQIEDLTASVLGGFARWARAHRGMHLRRGRIAAPLTGLMADTLVRRGHLQYLLITATLADR